MSNWKWFVLLQLRNFPVPLATSETKSFLKILWFQRNCTWPQFFSLGQKYGEIEGRISIALSWNFLMSWSSQNVWNGWLAKAFWNWDHWPCDFFHLESVHTVLWTISCIWKALTPEASSRITICNRKKAPKTQNEHGSGVQNWWRKISKLKHSLTVVYIFWWSHTYLNTVRRENRNHFDDIFNLPQPTWHACKYNNQNETVLLDGKNTCRAS